MINGLIQLHTRLDWSTYEVARPCPNTNTTSTGTSTHTGRVQGVGRVEEAREGGKEGGREGGMEGDTCLPEISLHLCVLPT